MSQDSAAHCSCVVQYTPSEIPINVARVMAQRKLVKRRSEDCGGCSCGVSLSQLCSLDSVCHEKGALGELRTSVEGRRASAAAVRVGRSRRKARSRHRCGVSEGRCWSAHVLDANAQFQSTWIKRPIWIKLDRLPSLLLKYFRSSLSFIRNTDLACCQQPSRVPQQAPPAAMSVNLCRHSVRCAVQLRVCLFFLWVVPCRDVPIHDEASRRDSFDWDRDHMATYCASGPYHVFVFVMHFRNIMRFSCRFCDSSVQFFSAVPRSSALAQLCTPLMHAMNSNSVLIAHVLAGLLTAGCCLHPMSTDLLLCEWILDDFSACSVAKSCTGLLGPRSRPALCRWWLQSSSLS